MLNKEDKIQMLVAFVFIAIALILSLTVLPPRIRLMDGGKEKSNLFLVLLTALPLLSTWIVASAEKSRWLSWILLGAIECWAATIALNIISGFTFNTELLFHGLFLVLETLLAIHLARIKDTGANCAFHITWVTSDEGFIRVQRVASRCVFLLAVAEGVNLVLSHFGIYSFTVSAIITIVLCYADFILISVKTKNID